MTEYLAATAVVLSLSAAFGALVWIFQWGHLGALGTTATGFIVASIPMLMFCVAFGLSMDYEVFLIARIREFWLASGKTSADNDESVALGLARTGRVITAAALVADELAPGAVDWWRAGHVSTEPAHGIALRRLGLTPLLDLDMRLGEASGALAALPLVTAATDILATMATFGEAGVSDG